MGTKTTARMTRAQTKYLLDRLALASWVRRTFHSPAEPSHVVRARQVIKRYEQKLNRAATAQENRHRTAYRKAKELIHFGSEKDALDAIRKVEDMLGRGTNNVDIGQGCVHTDDH